MQFKKAKIIMSALMLSIGIQQTSLYAERMVPDNTAVPKKLAITDSFKNFIVMIVAKASHHNTLDALSEPLCRCYERIINGKSTVLTTDVIGAYPELVREFQTCIQLNKAPRPGGTNPPVGPIIECNVQEVAEFVNDVSNIINSCCNGLQQDFEYTWTFLSEIQNAINISSTLISIENTLTACCVNITNNFVTTLSILADLDETLVFDFNGVFTMLGDIQDHLQATTAFVDFSPIFTVLDEIDATITVDFDGTFTTITDIKNTVTECLCGTLDGTFTVLADIKNTLTIDFDGTFTLLEYILNNGGTATFTGLEAFKNTLTTNFDGTFTVLEDIKNTLTECCENLQQDFEDTWTVLADIQETIIDNFDGTFTALAALTFSGTVIADFNSVYTTLNADFDGTFTIIEAIKNTVTAMSLDGTFSILEEIPGCFAISITAPTNITTAGYYCLANDVVGSFTITANDVVLDLNSSTISGGGIFILTGSNRTVTNGRLDSTNDGIVMTTNFNTRLKDLTITNATTTAITENGGMDNTVTDVVIENGTGGIVGINDASFTIHKVTINGMTSFGMSFTSNNNLTIDKVTISNIGSDGIDMNNPVNARVKNSTITNASMAGIITYGTTLRCNFEDIEISNAVLEYGFNLNNASFCTLKRCSVANINSAPLAGFIGILLGPSGATTGNNTIDSCIIQNINSTGVPPTNAGIRVFGINCIITGCTVQGFILNNQAVGASFLSGFRIDAADSMCINCHVTRLENQNLSTGDIVRGFYLNGNRVIAKNCTVTDTRSVLSDTRAFSFEGTNLSCLNCAASYNNAPLDDDNIAFGNTVLSGDGLLLKNCYTSNWVGERCFYLNRESTAMVGCQACNNSLGTAFKVLGSSDIVVLNCTAINNDIGFDSTGIAVEPAIYNCFAAQNGTDYVDVDDPIQSPGEQKEAGSNVSW